MSAAYPDLSPIATGIACRCPRCGRGRLFSGVLTVAAHCTACGLALAENDNGDGPAVFLIFILGFSVVPMALYVASLVTWPLWLHGIVWSVVILGLTLGMLRPAKGLVLALQFRHRPDSFAPPPDGNQASDTNDGAV